MSSTNRGAKRQEFDYYVTDPRHVVTFLRAWAADSSDAARVLRSDGYVLDPCAGGNTRPRDWEYKPGHVTTVPVLPCSYGVALREFGCRAEVIENDIRLDSPAAIHDDFLSSTAGWGRPDVIITNPPFSIAMEVIRRSLEVVSPTGWVVMLLRLNFLGSQKRFDFFQRMMPQRIYVHHERMGFVPGKPSETDSVEYAHMVFRPSGGLSAVTRVI